MSDESTMPEEPTGDEFAKDELFPEQEELETSKRRPVTARGIAIVGGRAAVGLVGIGVAALTIAASTFLPLPTVQSTAPSTLITPVPTAQQLVCPGGILRLASDSGQDATLASGLGPAAVRSGSSSGSVESVDAANSDAGTGGTSSAPTIISTPPDAADPTQRVLLSGAQSQQVESGDYVGLAAADCGIALGDSWLAGGATTVGRTTLITLTNPTEVSATVNLQLFGEGGAIAAPGTSGIIVPASGQRVLSLAGFAPGLVSPVVQVTSAGGQVHATMQQSILRGLDPGGVDIVESSAPPSAVSIIPGVVVTDQDAVQLFSSTSSASEVLDDFPLVLRLFAPGDGLVPVTVSVIPESGAGTGASFSYDLVGGRVADIPMQELEAGSYTVVVESTVPSIASVRASSVAGESTDFAWFTSAQKLSSSAQFTAALGPAPVLHLYNPTGVEATVAVTPLGAEAKTVVVPAGASAVLPVQGGENYGLSGFDALYAAVSISGNGMLARYTVHPPGVGSSPITVYP
ncbi:MAG: DUF5719 family protein [Rhodoglobus sp.]